MWIYTNLGFYSVVCASDRPLSAPSVCEMPKNLDVNTVMIRARVRSHLVRLQNTFPNLLEGVAIVDTKHRDYCARMVVPKVTWAALLQKLAERMDYGNFKGAVERDLPEERAYSRALHATHSLASRMQLEVASQPPTPLVPETTREFVANVRKQLRHMELNQLPLHMLSTMRKLGWIEMRGDGQEVRNEMTAEGKARLVGKE